MVYQHLHFNNVVHQRMVVYFVVCQHNVFDFVVHQHFGFACCGAPTI
jgi:hypothetical protein